MKTLCSKAQCESIDFVPLYECVCIFINFRCGFKFYSNGSRVCEGVNWIRLLDLKSYTPYSFFHQENETTEHPKNSPRKQFHNVMVLSFE